MKNFAFSLLAALFLSTLSVICSPVDISPTNSAVQSRAAETCADPSLADVYVEGFNPSRTLNVIRPRWVFVNRNADGDVWQIEGEIFCAWQTAQDFTVPIYQLFNPTTDDAIFLPSTDGNPPAASGFEIQLIVGYVYATQVCGSVPLLGAFEQTDSDHWYTTNLGEHSSLLANGWVDAGIAGYVLPLSSCS